MVFSDILAKYSQVITVNENQRDLQSFVTECVAFFSCKVAQNDVLSADDRMALLKLFRIPDNYDVFVSMTSQINLPLLGFSEEEVDEIALRIIEKELELKVSVSHEPVEIINIDLVDQYRNKYSTLLSAFFKKIKHQDNYLQIFFDRVIESDFEYVGGSDNPDNEVSKLMILVEMMSKIIDKNDFLKAENVLVPRFIQSQSLPLIHCIIIHYKDYLSEKSQEALEEAEDLIRKEIAEDEIEKCESIAIQAPTKANQQVIQQLQYHPNFQKAMFLHQNGVMLFDEAIRLDSDVLEGILLSLDVDINDEDLSSHVNFACEWITSRWLSAEMIDKYAQNLMAGLLEHRFGLMPTITCLEPLDYAYMRQVAQGQQGIIRHKEALGFQDDEKRSFSYLLYPTNLNKNHFGLLLFHFNDQGEVVYGIYFEPKESQKLASLSETVARLPLVPLLPFRMKQIDSTFCGDYVITLLKGFACGVLNLDKFFLKEADNLEAATLSADVFFSEEVNFLRYANKSLSMETIEFIRCQMAIFIGNEFVNDLNPGMNITPEQFDKTIRPKLEERCRVLSESTTDFPWQKQQKIAHSSSYVSTDKPNTNSGSQSPRLSKQPNLFRPIDRPMPFFDPDALLLEDHKEGDEITLFSMGDK